LLEEHKKHTLNIQIQEESSLHLCEAARPGDLQAPNREREESLKYS
jgi:hypothetical protein